VRVASALFLCTVCSCGLSDMKQETLDALYPPGFHRDEILGEYGDRGRSRELLEGTTDAFAARVGWEIEGESGILPEFFDRYLVPRNWFGLCGTTSSMTGTRSCFGPVAGSWTEEVIE